MSFSAVLAQAAKSVSSAVPRHPMNLPAPPASIKGLENFGAEEILNNALNDKGSCAGYDKQYGAKC